MYTVFWYICRAVVNTFFRMEVSGAEAFPKEGPVIIFSNHRNNWDPFIIACHIKRPIHFMAKAELFKSPLLKFILKRINAFPVHRGHADRKAIKAALKILERGNVLGIFPEGTRNPSGRLIKPEPGIALFAVKNRETILVPAAIKGGYKAFSKVQLILGKPYRPDLVEGKYNSKMLKDLSAKIFKDIYKLVDM